MSRYEALGVRCKPHPFDKKGLLSKDQRNESSPRGVQLHQKGLVVDLRGMASVRQGRLIVVFVNESCDVMKGCRQEDGLSQPRGQFQYESGVVSVGKRACLAHDI